MINARIAVFASGNGSNAEEIWKYFKYHNGIQVALLITNNPDSPALQRAANSGIPSRVVTREIFEDGVVIKQYLKEFEITHLVLAGFLWLIPLYLLDLFPDRIINIHPSLLPKFGGKGMFGMKVHQAVKAKGEIETGVTIHIVNEYYDQGEILFQGRCVVKPEETPDEIRVNVSKLEHHHYPREIEKWIARTQKAS